MEQIKNIIESLLFVSDTPLSIERLKDILSGVEAKEIRKALETLAGEYEARKGAVYLGEIAGGYQIRTRPAYNEWIKLLLKPTPLRLSQPALETLAIIAYRQPTIRADIEALRGVDCGGVLRLLMERKLVRVLGRKEVPGRPLLYATTRQFLEMFNLKDLKELPSAHEIEAAGKRHPSKEDAPRFSVPTDADTAKNA